MCPPMSPEPRSTDTIYIYIYIYTVYTAILAQAGIHRMLRFRDIRLSTSPIFKITLDSNVDW